MIRYALLALLREQRDYGYQLKQRFEGLVGPSWRLNIGQVYQTLRALEAHGQVVEVRDDGLGATDTEARYAQRSRRLFEISPKGIQALDRWLARPTTGIQPMRDEVVVRLLALDQHRRDACPALLKARQRLYRRHQSRLVAFSERLERDEKARPASKLAIAGQLLQVQAYLDWLVLCERTLVVGEARSEARSATRGAGS